MDETAPAPFLASTFPGFLQATEALTRLPPIELEILVVYVRECPCTWVGVWLGLERVTVFVHAWLFVCVLYKA